LTLIFCTCIDRGHCKVSANVCATGVSTAAPITSDDSSSRFPF